ncbi:M23 family metallopeptidase [Gayadomonas joobiniege]|uniref:M23 family metallopeptidase n=1 Tax=Gayadomonas joobiniege TaxID=1234606 RepID=UPI000381B786|nr:M23 family metallopeptidase [Gayadomonas joobiniege]
MSIKLIYSGRNQIVHIDLSKKQLFLMLLSVAALMLVLVYSVNQYLTTNETLLNPIEQPLQQVKAQKTELNLLKSNTLAELAAIKLKLSELQSYAIRMNALGAKLVDESDLNPAEFDFTQPSAIGGPASESVDWIAELDIDHELLTQMDTLMSKYQKQEQQLSLLESLLLNQNISDEIYISGRPIKSGWLSSYYGLRKDPFNGMPAMHKGLDFAGKNGSPIISTGAGIVTFAGERYGYGKLIEIDHGQGLKTRYGHNQEILVSVGDVVNKGTQIGVMGSTGRSTGPHVHYEILRHGKQIDPLKYVYRRAK